MSTYGPPPIPSDASETKRTIGANQYACLAVIIMVTIGFAAWSVNLYQKTIVDWWMPPLFGIALGVIFMRPLLGMWRWLTTVNRTWLLICFNLICFCGIGSAVMLASNFYAASQATERPVKAVIDARVRTKHNNTRRVGRRYIANTGSYHYTYHLKLRFPSGVVKQPRVPQDVYLNCRRGDTLTLVTRHGWLDWPVYDPPTKLPKRHKARRKRRPPSTRGDRPLPDFYRHPSSERENDQ